MILTDVDQQSYHCLQHKVYKIPLCKPLITLNISIGQHSRQPVTHTVVSLNSLIVVYQYLRTVPVPMVYSTAPTVTVEYPCNNRYTGRLLEDCIVKAKGSLWPSSPPAAYLLVYDLYDRVRSFFEAVCDPAMSQARTINCRVGRRPTVAECPTNTVQQSNCTYCTVVDEWLLSNFVLGCTVDVQYCTAVTQLQVNTCCLLLVRAPPQ